jgi:hypothetical protein
MKSHVQSKVRSRAQDQVASWTSACCALAVLSFAAALAYATPSFAGSPAATGNRLSRPITTSVAPAPAPLPANWNSWLNALKSAGYTVSQGASYLVDGTACQMYIEYFGNCGGNNPVAPYFIVQVPVIAAQYLDPYYAAQFATTTSSGVPISEFYRLADNEALVVVVSMPPQGAYFGYQSNIYTRDITKYPLAPPTSNSDGSTIMPDPYRVATFGSIGNAINNVIIQKQTGAKWGGSLFGAITTSNSSLDAALRKVMDHSTRMNSKLLVSEPVGDFIYTGIGQTADEFYTMIRYALPENQSDGDAWAAAPQNHIWVFRVTDNSGAAVTRNPTPAYTQKKASDESSLLSAQQELANLLLNYSQTTLGYPAAISSMSTTVSYGSDGELKGLVGQTCIGAGVPCAGDDQDTDAYRVQILGPVTGAQAVYTVGVDHTQFPSVKQANATYISIGVYDGPTLTGIAGVWQTNKSATGFLSGTLTGSAKTMLNDLGLYDLASSNLQSQLKYLYAVSISRTCPAGKAWCVTFDDTQIPEVDNVVLSERAYMRVGTTTGGNPDVMLTPMTIHPNSSVAQ